MDTFSNEEGRVVHPLFRTQIKDNTKPTTAVPISVATPSQSDDTLASDLPKPKMDIDNHSKNSKKKIKKKNIKPGDEMKKKKKKKSSDEKRHKSKSEKKKKKKEPKSKIKSEEEKEDGNEKGIDTKQIFRENIRKLKTLIVLKKLFGIETEKLVEGEKKSDMQYRKRTSDIMAICMAQSNYDKLIHDWDTPLFHSPLSMEEIKALSVKSAFHTKSESRSHNQLHLPTDLEKLCEVTFITGYELSLKAQCFYNDTDIERFRYDECQLSLSQSVLRHRAFLTTSFLS
jgi:hypothetical protein